MNIEAKQYTDSEISDYLEKSSEQASKIESITENHPNMADKCSVVVCVPVHFRERELAKLLQLLKKQTIINETEVVLLINGKKSDRVAIPKVPMPSEPVINDLQDEHAYKQYERFMAENNSITVNAASYHYDGKFDRAEADELMTYITARRATESNHPDPSGIIMVKIDADTSELDPKYLEKIKKLLKNNPDIKELDSREDNPYHEFYGNHLHFAVKRFQDITEAQIRHSRSTAIRSLEKPQTAVAKRLIDQIEGSSDQESKHWSGVNKVIKSGRRQLHAIDSGIRISECNDSEMLQEKYLGPEWMMDSIQSTVKVTGNFAKKLEMELQAFFNHYRIQLIQKGLSFQDSSAEARKLIARSASIMGITLEWIEKGSNRPPECKITDLEPLKQHILKHYDHS